MKLQSTLLASLTFDLEFRFLFIIAVEAIQNLDFLQSFPILLFKSDMLITWLQCLDGLVTNTRGGKNISCPIDFHWSKAKFT